MKLVSLAIASCMLAAVASLPAADASPTSSPTWIDPIGASAAPRGADVTLIGRLHAGRQPEMVTFDLGELHADAMTDDTGLARASFHLDLPVGRYTLVISYAGRRTGEIHTISASRSESAFDVTALGLGVELPDRVASGALTTLAVTALAADGTVDALASGAPALTSWDRTFSPGSCTPYQAGVAQCAGVRLGDLGEQVVTARDGDGRGGASGGNVAVDPVGLRMDYWQTVTEVGRLASFYTTPAVGVEGARPHGYVGRQSLRATSGESSAERRCVGSSCEHVLSFNTPGRRSILATETIHGFSTPEREVLAEQNQELTLAAQPAKIVAEQTLSLSGRLTSRGVARAGQQVRVTDALTSTIYTLTTDTNGVFGLRVRPTQGRPYWVDADSSEGFRAPVRASAVVDVATLVTATPLATQVAAGTPVRIRGRTNPIRPGKYVALRMVRSDGSLYFLGNTQIDARGGYGIVRVLPRGSYALYVTTPGYASNLPGKSSPVRVRVY